MEGIKKFFIEKGYSVSLLKHYFNTGLFGDFKYGKEKINLFIGFDNTVKDFIGVLKQSGKEIKFD